MRSYGIFSANQINNYENDAGSLTKLPDELIIEILKYADLATWKTVCKTSQSMNNVVRDQKVSSRYGTYNEVILRLRDLVTIIKILQPSLLLNFSNWVFDRIEKISLKYPSAFRLAPLAFQFSGTMSPFIFSSNPSLFDVAPDVTAFDVGWGGIIGTALVFGGYFSLYAIKQTSKIAKLDESKAQQEIITIISSCSPGARFS